MKEEETFSFLACIYLFKTFIFINNFVAPDVFIVYATENCICSCPSIYFTCKYVISFTSNLLCFVSLIINFTVRTAKKFDILRLAQCCSQAHFTVTNSNSTYLLAVFVFIAYYFDIVFLVAVL